MLKTKVLDLFVRLNAFAPFRFLNRDKVAILMYHRFAEDEVIGKTSRATFERHLTYLSRHYKFISLDDLAENRQSGKPLPERSVIITIDDGYDDFYRIAYPILKRSKIPAAIFVVTGFIDGRNWIWTDKARYAFAKTSRDDCAVTVGSKVINVVLGDELSRLAAAGLINAELKKLADVEKESALIDLGKQLGVTVTDLPAEEYRPFGWEEAREMLNAKITIGSHTDTHPILTRVDDARLFEELATSRSVLQEKLQIDATHFCYPNGNVGNRERVAIEDAGYATAVTTELRLCEDNDNLLMLPRIDAEPEMHRFVQATSGFDRFKK